MSGRVHRRGPIRVGAWLRRDAAPARLLRRHIASIHASFEEDVRTLAATPAGQTPVHGAAQWLLDNDYIIEGALDQVVESLPSHFIRELPRAEDGWPAVLGLAREYWATVGELDLDRLGAHVEQHQAEKPLTIGELWALPAFLRLTVAEDLAGVSHEAAEMGRAGVVPEDEPPHASQGAGTKARNMGASPIMSPSAGLEERVAACVITLRSLGAADWPAFVERVGVVDRILRKDPAGAYPKMEFATRDTYRKGVESLARSGRLSEAAVAEAAVELANTALTDRMRHVGAYLVAEGRPALEARLAVSVGWRRRLTRALRRRATECYLGAIALVTICILALPAVYTNGLGADAVELALVLLVTVVPSTGLAVAIVNRAVALVVTARLLPKMDFADGIAPEWPTLVAIPALLEEDQVEALLLGLEMCYLGNDDPLLTYALLVDPPDAAEQYMPDDAALLDRMCAGVHHLNRRYDPRTGKQDTGDHGPFALLARDRQWNPVERRWMGWERKRGKLEELNRLLLGKPSSLRVAAGDANRMIDVMTVITLDADTNLPAGAAARLVGTVAHPLNRPVFEEDGASRVVAGYTVIQPRVETAPASAASTVFARVYSGNTALDLYTHAVSDVYQDLFGVGVFTGKGIYDVAGFARSLEGAVPENRILSHDLFEGIHGRVGLASDIVVYEDYPAGVLEYMRRMHRWVRGDWQLLPWLLPRVPSAKGSRANTFGFVDRWKIADNLRRTLLPIAVLALLVAGWTVLPGSPWVWTLLGLGVVSSPVLLAPVTAAQRIATGERWLASGQDTLWTMRDQAVRVVLDTALLPYETLVIGDAVARTLYRLAVTLERLLEWTTASQVGKRLTAAGRLEAWRMLAPSFVMALGVFALVAVAEPATLPVALPFILLWCAAPEIAHRVSQREAAPADVADPSAHRELRRIARKTWLYFERHVGPEGHWLSPDHYQEDPLDRVARRTSPTNIGLGLLSALAAFDRGYVTAVDLVRRLESAQDSMARLERRRGHFFNWYDTRDLRPLEPRYVSTVDSGNLAGALLALAEGVDRVPNVRLPRKAERAGLLDTLDVLRETVRHIASRGLAVERRSIVRLIDSTRRLLGVEPTSIEAWAEVLAHLEQAVLPDLERRAVHLLEGTVDPSGAPAVLRMWLGRLRHDVQSQRRDLDLLTPWARFLADVPPLSATAGSALRDLHRAAGGRVRLRDIPRRCREITEALEALNVAMGVERAGDVADWLTSFRDALGRAESSAEEIQAAVRTLGVRARTTVEEMDFAFLYDPARKLFRIGFNVTDDLPDNSHYDLLASEARLASFVAIAAGDVPESHWLHLGRPYGRVAGAASVLSWGASAFEYLMPRLVMFHPRGSLLDVSCRAAVTAHRRFAERHGIPWGMSESAYYAFDVAGEYQYRSFGVPGLGLKRDLGDRLVVAPYASFLALPYEPAAVLDNVRRLSELGAEGTYGFYDALDFGDPDMGDQEPRPVRTYMSHHQAMLLLAVHNYLSDDIMVRRFHSAPQVLAAERLLYEQRPRRAPSVTTWRPEVKPPSRAAGVDATPAWDVSTDSATPQLQILSGGALSTLISARGGGRIMWNGLAVTPPDYDAATENVGLWTYVRDSVSGNVWSASAEPIPGDGARSVVRFSPHDATFQRVVHGIATYLTVTAVTTPDAEIRHLRVVNESRANRRITITSFGEVALDEPGSYARHPAFSRLFVESRWVEEVNAVVFRRRWREETALGDPTVLHAVVSEYGARPSVRFETDRGAFVGRGGSAHSPAGLGTPLRGGTGATLDPAMVLELDLELGPGEDASLAFVTIAAATQGAAVRALSRLDSLPRIDRARDNARRAVALEQFERGLNRADVRLAQKLLSAVFAGGPELRVGSDVLASPHLGQRGLWSHGISGDIPIILVKAMEPAHAGLAEQLLRMHAFWRGKGIHIDLVFLDESASGYDRPLQDRLTALIEETGGMPWLHRHGGVHLVDSARLPSIERQTLEACASVAFDARHDDLAERLRSGDAPPTGLPAFVPLTAQALPDLGTPVLPRADGLQFHNGLGGFSADGSEYVIRLEPGATTPAPWANVISNPLFGCVVTERGLGTTWSMNSGEHRLTPWRNDPLIDQPSEAVYLRDEETGAIWSTTPEPAGADTAYEIRHGTGYSMSRHASHGLRQGQRTFVAPDAPVKIVWLRLENLWPRGRRITVTYFAEWVLGTRQAETGRHVVTAYDHDAEALLAHSRHRQEFAERTAFLTSSEPVHGLTTDRREFLGLGRRSSRPEGLERVGLSGTVNSGADPCAALQVHLDLEPGEVRELHFVLGEGDTKAHALALARKYRQRRAASQTWDAVRRRWDGLLANVQVDTPDPAMNLLINRWLPYQILSCRVWGRTAVYQSSGAFGFRDVLQDVCALLWVDPGIARAQILDAAAHQFEEGDVLHWWHPPLGAGVRTRISDDLLWLPYAVARYVRWTGDRSILGETVPFLRGEQLADAHERYAHFEPGEQASLFEHCVRAIRRGATAGSNGLPLFGTGDWNDGMNRVGAGGKGESVWLGWFLITVLEDFAVTAAPDDAKLALKLRNQAGTLREAIEASSWDGGWYRRGTFDDSTPLGSAGNVEARIDTIAQAWAVISGAGDPDRAEQAMNAVEEQLLVRDPGLLLLLAPPFDHSTPDPGYIRAYPPGIRENGGQYTHAAVWGGIAFAEHGRAELAHEIFGMLGPVRRTATEAGARAYRGEPYAVAADVYGVPPHVGRAGWTWYTGAAGWLYRFGLEHILGMTREGKDVNVAARVPASWPGFSARVLVDGVEHRVEVPAAAVSDSGAGGVVGKGTASPVE